MAFFLKFIMVNLWTAQKTRVFTVPPSQGVFQKPLFSSGATWFFTWKLLENRLFCLICGARDFHVVFFFVFEGVPWKVKNPSVLWCWWQTFPLIWICFLIGKTFYLSHKKGEKKRRKPAQMTHEHHKKHINTRFGVIYWWLCPLAV